MTDIKKLIELAKSAKLPDKDDNLSEKLNDAERFVIAFGIKTGKWNVRVDYLYKVYSEWTLNPIHRMAFCKQIAKIIPTSHLKRGKIQYKINHSFQHLIDLRKRLTRVDG